MDRRKGEAERATHQPPSLPLRLLLHPVDWRIVSLATVEDGVDDQGKNVQSVTNSCELQDVNMNMMQLKMAMKAPTRSNLYECE